MKKRISTFIAIVMALTCMCGSMVYASEFPDSEIVNGTARDSNAIPGAAEAANHDEGSTTYSTVLDGRLRSTSPPTSFHDLSSGNYFADLEYVKAGWLYTNRYFYSNSDAEIYVNYDVVTNGVYGAMRIGIYDCTDEEMVTWWDTEYFADSGVSGDMYFYNLDETHQYAVAFTALRNGAGSIPSITGEAVISH